MSEQNLKDWISQQNNTLNNDLIHKLTEVTNHIYTAKRFKISVSNWGCSSIVEHLGTCPTLYHQYHEEKKYQCPYNIKTFKNARCSGIHW